MGNFPEVADYYAKIRRKNKTSSPAKQTPAMGKGTS
jgi:hypothetical protein